MADSMKQVEKDRRKTGTMGAGAKRLSKMHHGSSIM